MAFDGSRVALGLARATGRLLNAAIDRAEFQLAYVRDEDENLVRLRVTYKDLGQVQGEIISNLSDRTGRRRPDPDLFPFFLAKSIATTALNEPQTVTRALLITQVSVWLARQERACPVSLFLERRPWMDTIRRYGGEYGLDVHSAGRSVRLNRLILSLLSPGAIAAIRIMLSKNRPQRLDSRRDRPDGSSVGSPLIAVHHHGHLNLSRSERHSDFFFWQNSTIRGSDVMAVFWMPQIPVDGDAWEELSSTGIRGVALDPRCPGGYPVPFFQVGFGMLMSDLWSRIALRARRVSDEKRWLLHSLIRYQGRRDYWIDLFARTGVRIHVNWYWEGEEHVAIAAAMEHLGGVSAIYQRSLDLVPSSEMAIAADVFFGFSRDSVEREIENGSRLRYAVITGYLGDHRFPLLREYAAAVRDQVREAGAEQVMAFFDESSEDDRWDIGHEMQKENYAFLLERVLEHEWFGLVLKPKVPATLGDRLGSVRTLLSRAVATRRCFVFEGGPLQADFPPAAAALAADIGVGGHLCAPTAGFEAVLAGVPTLLMDREGWHLSPLYQLGVGRVVFENWDDLWSACSRHREEPLSVPGFGDWSTLIDRFDPFRDGYAAGRMGQFLQWTLEGLTQGQDRDTALANAARSYGDRWGDDKVRRLSTS